MSKEIIDNTELTQDEKKEIIRKNEDDILSALLTAANYRNDEDEAATVEIVRSKKLLFSFRIRPMSEEEYLKARNEHAVYRKNKATGGRTVDHVNTARYRSQLIYNATVEEDRAKLWDNREAWRKLNVVTGVDLIDVVLKSGEKEAVIDKLDEISGYQLSLEETAKN